MSAGAARCLLLAGLPLAVPALRAQGIEPYHAQEVQPYRAQEVKPHQAQAVKPTRAPEVTPYRAQPTPSSAPPAASQDPGFFFRTFGLAVPGAAYSWDDAATGTRTHVVSAGAQTKSWVQVNPDHTYVWFSTWVGRTLHGRWIPHRDGLLLQRGQEGKDWILGRLPRPSGAAVVYLFDGDWMTYHGTPKPGGG